MSKYETLGYMTSQFISINGEYENYLCVNKDGFGGYKSALLLKIHLEDSRKDHFVVVVDGNSSVH